MVKTEEGKARLASVFHNLGDISMQSKEYQKSVEAFKQSLRLNPKDDETRYNLALAQKLLENQQNENQDQNQDQQNQDKKKTRKIKTISSSNNNSSSKTTRKKIRLSRNNNRTNR